MTRYKRWLGCMAAFPPMALAVVSIALGGSPTCSTAHVCMAKPVATDPKDSGCMACAFYALEAKIKIPAAKQKTRPPHTLPPMPPSLTPPIPEV